MYLEYYIKCRLVQYLWINFLKNKKNNSEDIIYKCVCVKFQRRTHFYFLKVFYVFFYNVHLYSYKTSFYHNVMKNTMATLNYHTTETSFKNKNCP